MDKATLARLQPALKALKKQTRAAAADRRGKREEERRADQS
jgi:hypothetical protein